MLTNTIIRKRVNINNDVNSKSVSRFLKIRFICLAYCGCDSHEKLKQTTVVINKFYFILAKVD